MEDIQFYTDDGRWYPEACNVLGLKHHLHSPLETNLIERVMQYFKDRTESFDDYYPGIQKEENECNLLHVHNWIQFFVSKSSVIMNVITPSSKHSVYIFKNLVILVK
jgi:transposase-like protein